MTPREEAAVEAACRAVRAHGGRGRGQARASRSAADVLNERLDLDWSSFDGRGYELLREANRRVSGAAELAGGSPDDPQTAGPKYEERYSSARRRLTRASA